MSLKKKLGLGMASAALGISLVGGGTFAYFNDVETVNNAFAAGELDLSIIELHRLTPINFDLSNLKPGDSVTRQFGLTANNGSLAIKDVLMSLTANNYIDGGESSENKAAMKKFLSQFEVTMMKGIVKRDNANENPDDDNAYQFTGSYLETNKTVTLLDLYNGDFSSFVDDYVFKANVNGNEYGAERLNLTPTGLSVDPDDADAVQIKITFKDNGKNQNEFQQDGVDVQFVLEATQFDGTTVDRFGKNGYMKQNEKLQFDADAREVGKEDTTGGWHLMNPDGTDGSTSVDSPTTVGNDHGGDE